MLYLHSSAIVKLVAREPESEALARVIANDPEVVSSALAWTEVVRAARRWRSNTSGAEQVVASIPMIPIDDGILRRAAELPPVTLRTLDAIHIATALSIREDLAALVTYDARMAEAATEQDLRTLSPASA
ncbi:MAG: type II toxin-antitoxin system VapC family toxin [Actinomycetota bacterium]